MLYIRGGTYWTKFKHRGQYRYESTGVALESPNALGEAQAQERRIRAQRVLDAGPGGRHTSDVTLAVLEEIHIEKLENDGYGRVRLETVRNLYRHLQRHLGEHRDVMTLEARDLETYEGMRRREGVRGQTIRRERGALKRSMRLAKRDGLIACMPFDWDDLERIKSNPKKKSQSAKLHPIERINDVLRRLSAKARTAGHHEICRFVMMTGLRSTELARSAGFEVRRLRKRGKHVATLDVPDDGSKTSDPRTLPLTTEALRIYDAWSHRFAVVDIAHALNRASKKAGIVPGVTLRDLRKFYLSHAARKDLPAAQKLAGHTSVATTARYVDADLGRALAAGASVTHLARARGGDKGGDKRDRTSKNSNVFKGARSSGG